MSTPPLPRFACPPLDDELALPPLPDPVPTAGIVVEHSDAGIVQVRILGKGAPGALAVDLRSEESRRRFAEGKKGLLGRATGIAKGAVPTVWDATAGLGRDAMRLAVLGATVVAWERDPVVHALLTDGLRRAAEGDDELAVAARERITLRNGDACVAMRDAHAAGEPPPEVILLDPMFPERGAALPKREAQVLAALCGEGGNAEEDAALFVAARAWGAKRVIVKRPRHAPTLAGEEPAHRFEGKSVRFDLYLG